jgi:hypothetical protein
MRLIIEAHMEDEQTSSTATEAATIVAVVERQPHDPKWDAYLMLKAA